MAASRKSKKLTVSNSVGVFLPKHRYYDPSIRIGTVTRSSTNTYSWRIDYDKRSYNNRTKTAGKTTTFNTAVSSVFAAYKNLETLHTKKYDTRVRETFTRDNFEQAESRSHRSGESRKAYNYYEQAFMANIGSMIFEGLVDQCRFSGLMGGARSGKKDAFKGTTIDGEVVDEQKPQYKRHECPAMLVIDEVHKNDASRWADIEAAAKAGGSVVLTDDAQERALTSGIRGKPFYVGHLDFNDFEIVPEEGFTNRTAKFVPDFEVLDYDRLIINESHELKSKKVSK